MSTSRVGIPLNHSPGPISDVELFCVVLSIASPSFTLASLDADTGSDEIQVQLQDMTFTPATGTDYYSPGNSES
ncbi:hypothetical protein CEXT_536181 [Caerostris extrusa]|uniref:Uncharacterized protein n=1 Tax=Caerostris extrusa TaxID=172846 RepID=A0AAV4M821_CAEEX|nr:hypothetical protein CEXT_536181 [Caerostris extrusa]